MIRKLSIFGLLAILLTGCFASPTLIPYQGKDYRIVEHDERKFVYITYNFTGTFNFDEAVELQTALYHWANERGIFVEAIARFPGASRLWQLGFTATELPEDKTFREFKVESMDLPAGNYAILYGEGNTAHYFKYWESLKQTLIADGYKVVSPVFELYIDMFDDSIPKDLQKGGAMYRVE